MTETETESVTERQTREYTYESPVLSTKSTPDSCTTSDSVELTAFTTFNVLTSERERATETETE